MTNIKINKIDKIERILAALARQGLTVTHAEHTWRVRLKGDDGLPADVLLPDHFPVGHAAEQRHKRSSNG